MVDEKSQNQVSQTVILCTYNRSEELSKALESLAAQRLPVSENWEILVVDNGSTDKTRAVVEDYCANHSGRFRYLWEPRPGKSNALNSGILAAHGSILAFTDDDATFDPDWLHNLTSSLHSGEWAGAGGRTLASRQITPPPWLALNGPFNMGGVVAATFDLGDKPLQLVDAPYGVNMAFRKDIFEKHGSFRTDLGPTPHGDVPRPNEDTELGRRVILAGERLRYEPSAIVYHPVHEDRVRKDYLLNWWFDAGRATVREVGRKSDLWGIPRPYLAISKAFALMIVRVIRWLVALGAQRRFYRKCWVWKTAGQLHEMRRQWFHA